MECHNGYKAECGINNIKSIYILLIILIWLGRCMYVGSLYKYYSYQTDKTKSGSIIKGLLSRHR